VITDTEYADRLEELGGRLLAIGVDHGKCLACHCFREVVEEAAQLLEDAAATPDGESVAGRLRDQLAEREGTHG
jgi:aminoglycoside N3'-acetyltransferase